jgi:hypothetical protein
LNEPAIKTSGKIEEKVKFWDVKPTMELFYDNMLMKDIMHT